MKDEMPPDPFSGGSAFDRMINEGEALLGALAEAPDLDAALGALTPDEHRTVVLDLLLVIRLVLRSPWRVGEPGGQPSSTKDYVAWEEISALMEIALSDEAAVVRRLALALADLPDPMVEVVLRDLLGERP